MTTTVLLEKIDGRLTLSSPPLLTLPAVFQFDSYQKSPPLDWFKTSPENWINKGGRTGITSFGVCALCDQCVPVDT